MSVAENMRMVEDLDGTLAGYVERIRFEDLSASTIERTKCLMLDTVGAAMAAVRADGVQSLAVLISDLGGAPEARIVGSGVSVPAHHAALVNATAARALEIDDVHEKALTHATATIVPVALAVAEQTKGVSGRDLLTAVTAGIDVACRLSLAPTYSSTDENHEKHPMSLTYQTGTLAGALTAGKLRRLSSHDLQNTLGIAYSQCGGNKQCLLEGALTVRVQQGLCSMYAVLSLMLSRIGITGTMQSLEGEFGYYNTFHKGNYDRNVVVENLGRVFEGDNVSIKPYPCCKYTHTAISAALEARADPRFDAGSIERVVAHVNNTEYFDIVCRPVDVMERRRALQSEQRSVRAQFSLPYVVATALKKGGVGLEHMTDTHLDDAEVLSIMDRVETVIDPDDKGTGRIFPTPVILDVFIKGDPNPIRKVVQYAKGHPLNRMSYDEVAAKFMLVTEPVADLFPTSQRRRLIDLIADIESSDDVSCVLDLMTANA